jgi:hypothetical protein
LTVSDWVQAGRYAALLDPWVPAGGPVHFTPPGLLSRAVGAADAEGRLVTIPLSNIEPGRSQTIPVQLMASGDESAMGFSLDFDPVKLGFEGAILGAAAGGGTLHVNTSKLAGGKLGLVLSLPIGNHFAAGAREVVQLQFTAHPAAPGATVVSFSNDPVVREISDAQANALVADYVDGTITVAPKLRVVRDGDQLQLTWPAAASGYVLQTSESLGADAEWMAVDITPGRVGDPLEFHHVALPIGTARAFFRLHQP